MTRALAKYALYVVACAALIDFARFRRRQKDAAHRKEALHTWEGEGGALPETK
jgi:hypothetical protein